jgi:hypothetical protein
MCSRTHWKLSFQASNGKRIEIKFTSFCSWFDGNFKANVFEAFHNYMCVTVCCGIQFLANICCKVRAPLWAFMHLLKASFHREKHHIHWLSAFSVEENSTTRCLLLQTLTIISSCLVIEADEVEKSLLIIRFGRKTAMAHIFSKHFFGLVLEETAKWSVCCR